MVNMSENMTEEYEKFLKQLDNSNMERNVQKSSEFDKLFDMIIETNNPDLFTQALKAKYGSRIPMFPKELAKCLVNVKPIDRRD